MKTISPILAAALIAAANQVASAQDNNKGTAPPATPDKPAAAQATPAETPPAQSADSDLTNAPAVANADAKGIRLNFVNAPLETVLKYLSDAAGFHIVMDSPARGNVTVISSHPMSKDEAVALLNSVLNKNGLAAIRNEQFLTIVDRNEAKTRDIQVNVYNDDPKSIPKTDEIVTEIIPVRFVEAEQLTKDLSPFVSQQATIVANSAGNSIVITDTQANIRHLAEIIKAIDSSAEASTEIKVYRLKYANPTDVANLLSTIFPSQTGTSGTQTPMRFAGGGRGGFGGGFGGGPGGGPGGFFAQMMANASGNNNNQNDRIRKQTQVVATADLRTSSVVVTAQKDLIDQIDQMMERLDVPSERDAKVTVFHLDHGDPQDVANVLQNTFGSTSSTGSRSGSSSTANSALSARANAGINALNSSQSSSSSSLGGSRSSGLGGGSGVGGRSF